MTIIRVQDNQTVTFTVQAVDANGQLIDMYSEPITVTVVPSEPLAFTFQLDEDKKEELATKQRVKQRVVRLED